ncbi:hypothetical protein CDL15_Pgr018630 [Punica granatum]|uniref:Uncharacterized protein n=1 Tax=Punica granatum TaxID=22663 RepID=A0A218X0S1_PUNGR|nr:hypothetical protein CDL15_Pgr018630 [Punica granatum]
MAGFMLGWQTQPWDSQALDSLNQGSRARVCLSARESSEPRVWLRARATQRVGNLCEFLSQIWLSKARSDLIETIYGFADSRTTRRAS